MTSIRLLAASVLTIALSAQDPGNTTSPSPISKTIQVQVLSGKTGNPLKNQRLLIFGGASAEEVTTHKEKLDVLTDDSGVVVLPSDDPKLLRFNVFVDGFIAVCQDGPPPNLRSYAISEIETSGLTIPNSCGKVTRKAIPGKLVLFTRPYTLREKMES